MKINEEGKNIKMIEEVKDQKIDEIIMDSDNILDQIMKVSLGEKSPTTAKVDNVIPFL